MVVLRKKGQSVESVDIVRETNHQSLFIASCALLSYIPLSLPSPSPLSSQIIFRKKFNICLVFNLFSYMASRMLQERFWTDGQ